ncbi:hypothetical protein GCM10027399_18620 [Curvibacter fontanus]
MKRVLSTGLFLLLAGPAAAQTTSLTAASPAPTADGRYVIDPRSKLAWPRCVEGMAWNGKTCTGQPREMTHGEAVALATARFKAEGVAWRLPRLTELRRWAASEQGRALFPAAPQDWYWTSTSRIDTTQANPYHYGNIQQGRAGTQDQLGVQQGWALHMGTGEARGDVGRRTPLVVRLVRPQF